MAQDKNEDIAKTSIARKFSDLNSSEQAPTIIAQDHDEAKPPARPVKLAAGDGDTRLVGFTLQSTPETIPAAAPEAAAAAKPAPPSRAPVVGWLVVVAGKGQGFAREIYPGVNTVGRDVGVNRIALDFGDTAISREHHVRLFYDPIDNQYTIGLLNGVNIPRVNNTPLYDKQTLEPGDTIKIGETELRFVPLCGPDFHWTLG